MSLKAQTMEKEKKLFVEKQIEKNVTNETNRVNDSKEQVDIELTTNLDLPQLPDKLTCPLFTKQANTWIKEVHSRFILPKTDEIVELIEEEVKQKWPILEKQVNAMIPAKQALVKPSVWASPTSLTSTKPNLYYLPNQTNSGSSYLSRLTPYSLFNFSSNLIYSTLLPYPSSLALFNYRF